MHEIPSKGNIWNIKDKEQREWYLKDYETFKNIIEICLSIRRFPKELEDDKVLKNMVVGGIPVLSDIWSIEPIREELHLSQYIASKIIHQIPSNQSSPISIQFKDDDVLKDTTSSLTVFLQFTETAELATRFLFQEPKLDNDNITYTIELSSSHKDWFNQIMCVTLWILIYYKAVHTIQEHPERFLGDRIPYEKVESKNKLLPAFVDMITNLRSDNVIHLLRNLVKGIEKPAYYVGLFSKGCSEFSNIGINRMPHKALEPCYRWSYEHGLTDRKTSDPYLHYKIIVGIRDNAFETYDQVMMWAKKAEQARRLFMYLGISINRVELL